MSETDKTSVPESDRQIVKVGFGGALRPVKFTGTELCDTSSHTANGPNQNRWHEWTLYRVDGGYRVLDDYVTLWQDEARHSGLSRVLNGIEVAQAYPAVAAEAVHRGIFVIEVIAEDADEPRKPIDTETLVEFD